MPKKITYENCRDALTEMGFTENKDFFPFDYNGNQRVIFTPQAIQKLWNNVHGGDFPGVKQ